MYIHNLVFNRFQVHKLNGGTYRASFSTNGTFRIVLELWMESMLE
jgi:hypothetical protein